MRPTRKSAESTIRSWLSEAWPALADAEIQIAEDGDGWAWWIFRDDTTSYVHDDLSLECYGHVKDTWEEADHE